MFLFRSFQHQVGETATRLELPVRAGPGLRIRFVVQMHWAFQTQGHLFLVLDYCSGTANVTENVVKAMDE